MEFARERVFGGDELVWVKTCPSGITRRVETGQNLALDRGRLPSRGKHEEQNSHSHEHRYD
ncbi:MAG: hypothetical protein WAR57_12220 [Candidatus Phosphoribacter sp.]|nr:hypothetical protein [Actinomycetales bacterium]